MPDNPLFEKVVLVVLGWLLGLAGPAITDGIKRRRENALGRKAIQIELREVAHKLALATHGVSMHLGTVDRTTLEWLEGVLEHYAGVHDSKQLLENTRAQLAWSDAEIKAGAKGMAGERRKSLVLQKYAVPLLDARVSALWSFDTTTLRLLLEIKTSLDMLDDIVDRSRHYADLTFGKLENGNYELVVENVEQCYEQYAERARLVIGRIDQLKAI